jgi:hypothetical protein
MKSAATNNADFCHDISLRHIKPTIVSRVEIRATCRLGTSRSGPMFFLACLAATESEGVVLVEIRVSTSLVHFSIPLKQIMALVA